MKQLRRKRLKQGLEKWRAQQAITTLDETSEESSEEVSNVSEAKPRRKPSKTPLGISDIKLGQLCDMAAKYADSDVRLTIKAKDVEQITSELRDLREEVLRLRQCYTTFIRISDYESSDLELLDSEDDWAQAREN